MGHTVYHNVSNNRDDAYRNFVIQNKSNHSYAVNNKITQKFNAFSWAGKRCFIIGGGESVNSINLNQLDNECTIGINKAFQKYANATINYSMDSDFYDGLKSGRYNHHSKECLWSKWEAFKGVRVLLTPMEMKEFGKEVYLIRREWTARIVKGDLDAGIYGGSNSGIGAIMLAIALGCNEIYLLGYDCDVIRSTHFHGGYDDRDPQQFRNKLQEYAIEMTQIAVLFKRAGINIYNCNANSKLKCFDFVNLEEVLKGR